MIVELHTLTSHGPSNLNRDDFGRPKTAVYGGSERARISSQSLKRAIRISSYFSGQLEGRISTRSREIPALLFNRLAAHYEDTSRLRAACEAVAGALGKPDKKEPLHTVQTVFVTPDELTRLQAAIQRFVDSDESISKDLRSRLASEAGIDRPPHDAVDMALFGRMTTEEADTFATVEGAMQVMHAISTHAVLTEVDSFTAFDDIATSPDSRGSAYLNETSFNSAVYYKYFSCDLDLLARNLADRDAAVEALTAFMDAACRIAPTGMQNAFASHSLAGAALLVIRITRNRMSLVEAFERPVSPSEDGYLARSLHRLATTYSTIVRDYGLDDRAILYHRIDLDTQIPNPAYEEAASIQDLWSFLQRHTLQ